MKVSIRHPILCLDVRVLGVAIALCRRVHELGWLALSQAQGATPGPPGCCSPPGYRFRP